MTIAGASVAVRVATAIGIFAATTVNAGPASSPESIVCWGVPAISASMILPEAKISMTHGSSELVVSAARGEYESASCVLRLTGERSLVGTLSVSALKHSFAAAEIPEEAVDLRVVKVWYQSLYAWNEIGKTKPNDFRQTLVPELLLKDEGLVRTESGGQRNLVRVSRGTTSEYVWVNQPVLAPTDEVIQTFAEFPVRDSEVLQPVTISPGRNTQVWVTIRIPDAAVPGEYRGYLRLTADKSSRNVSSIVVNVLGFDLPKPRMRYGIYYRGQSSAAISGISSDYKTHEQMAAELRDLKVHGVEYPTLYQPFRNRAQLLNELALRRAIGFPTDAIYYLGIQTTRSYLGPDDVAATAMLARQTGQASADAREAGFSGLYVYGKDEARGPELGQQRGLWRTVHESGGKVFVAGYSGAHAAIGDLLDVFVHAYQPSIQEAALWHSTGKSILSYGNPQSGPENPYLFRLNYGLMLWANDYDGAMVYAYQHCFGGCWNDIDHPVYRDHNLAYPTVDGAIGTLALEGLREGIDDVRYMERLEASIRDYPSRGDARLKEAERIREQTRSEILRLSPSSGKYNKNATLDLDAIRGRVVRQIVALQNGLPAGTPP